MTAVVTVNGTGKFQDESPSANNNSSSSNYTSSSTTNSSYTTTTRELPPVSYALTLYVEEGGVMWV